MSEMVVSDIEEDANQGAVTDEDTPPHSYHNTDRSVGQNNTHIHNNQSLGGRRSQSQPRPQGRDSQRPQSYMKHPSPPGHMEDPYHPQQVRNK